MTRIRTLRHGTCALTVAGLLSCAAASVAANGYLDLRRIEPLHGDALAGKAKATVCMGCHGANGVAPVPAFPNLAGQHAEYLYWQLVEFKREARPESPMTAQVATLGDADMRNLAAYFAAFPQGGTVAGVEPADRGGALYRDGDPARGIPPCQGCHGAGGNGHPLAAGDARWRVYPLLRGQHADYIVQKLKDFRDHRHTLSSSDRIMTPIAQSLDDASIDAIAHWLDAPATQPSG
ncbi:MAG: c-type cytochrome [Lysobacterales bacterium]